MTAIWFAHNTCDVLLQIAGSWSSAQQTVPMPSIPPCVALAGWTARLQSPYQMRRCASSCQPPAFGGTAGAGATSIVWTLRKSRELDLQATRKEHGHGLSDILPRVNELDTDGALDPDPAPTPLFYQNLTTSRTRNVSVLHHRSPHAPADRTAPPSWRSTRAACRWRRAWTCARWRRIAGTSPAPTSPRSAARPPCTPCPPRTRQVTLRQPSPRPEPLGVSEATFHFSESQGSTHTPPHRP